jgi:asparagine synthase (glutamine-hydrolysing)
MCGIVGGISHDALGVEAGIASLQHRGPDDKGVWREGGAQLGFARLAIIDLSAAGHQPMVSPDGRHVIVFNGEIYNFPELRAELEGAGETFAGHSDTEVLLRLYTRLGLERCLARLRGMFAFAVWDRQEERLSLARDRLGVKPLVYAETAGGFLFGSEIQALFVLNPRLSRQPDFQGLDHYLTFQYIPAPMSGFAAVRKLPPAHAMTVKDGRVEKVFRYWDVDLARSSPLRFGEACEALREKLLEATRLRLVSDVPLGAFLSGGIDSSITVAAMARLGAAPLKTFSIGFEDVKFNELPHAVEVARHLGTDHQEMTVKADAADIMPRMIGHLGEPLADNSVIPTYCVSRFARSQVTVALTGDGGDEVFAGYRRFYQIRRMDWLARLGLIPAWRGLRRMTVALENRARPHKRRPPFPSTRADHILGMEGMERYKHLLAFFTDTEKIPLYTAALQDAIGRSVTTDYLTGQFNTGSAGTDTLNRYLRLDLKSFLPEDILFKVDITSMANSLECRSPFLDHELIELAFSLPGRYKLSAAGRHKHILKEAFRDWLPPGFMDRPKKGFSAPIGRWLKEDLSEMLGDLLIGNRTLAPWIRQDVVERYVREHVSGERGHGNRLWPLLVLALWVRRFDVAA